MFPDPYINEPTPSGGWWSWPVPVELHGDALWAAKSTLGFDPVEPEQPLGLTPSYALRAIEALATRSDGWDGYGGVAPTKETLALAKSLYWALPQGELPAVHAAGDGEVSFVWRNGDRYLEVGVDPGGGISFYGRAPGEQPLMGDLDALFDSLPDELLTFLSGFGDGGVRVRAGTAERA